MVGEQPFGPKFWDTKEETPPRSSRTETKYLRIQDVEDVDVLRRPDHDSRIE